MCDGLPDSHRIKTLEKEVLYYSKSYYKAIERVKAIEKELEDANRYIAELEESGNAQYSSRNPILPTIQ